MHECLKCHRQSLIGLMFFGKAKNRQWHVIHTFSETRLAFVMGNLLGYIPLLCYSTVSTAVSKVGNLPVQVFPWNRLVNCICVLTVCVLTQNLNP